MTNNQVISKARGECKIDGCDKPVVAWGTCDMHYRRFKKRGTYDAFPTGITSKHLIPLPTRFHAKYTPVPESGCWLWEGALAGKYGVIVQDGKNLSAHRYSWELHNGDIPNGLWVLHKCDTPSCVNPDHLFLGTAKDNMQDALRKGRLNYMPGVMAGAKAKAIKERE